MFKSQNNMPLLKMYDTIFNSILKQKAYLDFNIFTEKAMLDFVQTNFL